MHIHGAEDEIWIYSGMLARICCLTFDLLSHVMLNRAPYFIGKGCEVFSYYDNGSPNRQ